MKKIELIPGTDKGGSDSAFCLAAMSVAGVDASSLINAINENVVPFQASCRTAKGLPYCGTVTMRHWLASTMQAPVGPRRQPYHRLGGTNRRTTQPHS